MFLKFPKLFVLMYLFVGLTACSSGGDESGGVPGDFYFQISVDGAPVQRINIDVSGPEYDIMAWYNTATDKTTVLALLEWNAIDELYDKVFEFSFSGMGTGSQTVTLAEYWLNDGSNTNYKHIPFTQSSATLNITEYGQLAQPIVGEFDFKLCLDTAACDTNFKTVTGSFTLLRQPDRTEP